MEKDILIASFDALSSRIWISTKYLSAISVKYNKLNIRLLFRALLSNLCGSLVQTRNRTCNIRSAHYNDVIMSTKASQITSLRIVYSAIYSGAYQRKHQSSASRAFARGVHQWPVNSPHKRPVTRKMFSLDVVFMNLRLNNCWYVHVSVHSLKFCHTGICWIYYFEPRVCHFSRKRVSYFKTSIYTCIYISVAR